MDVAQHIEEHEALRAYQAVLRFALERLGDSERLYATIVAVVAQPRTPRP